MSSAARVTATASVPTIQSSGAANSHAWRRRQRPRAGFEENLGELR